MKLFFIQLELNFTHYSEIILTPLQSFCPANFIRFSRISLIFFFLGVLLIFFLIFLRNYQQNLSLMLNILRLPLDF
jgi:pilus assembly protein TadC